MVFPQQEFYSAQTVLLVAILVSLPGPEASKAVSKARLSQLPSLEEFELVREKQTMAGFKEQNWPISLDGGG